MLKLCIYVYVDELLLLNMMLFIFNNGLSAPRCVSSYLVPGFTPSMARFVHNNIISKEVCRVFVLRCQSASYLTSLVPSRRVHISDTIYIQSYELYASIHTFIHPYINNFICSYIHTFMRTQHIHIISLHMVALVNQSLGRLHPPVSSLTYCVSCGQS